MAFSVIVIFVDFLIEMVKFLTLSRLIIKVNYYDWWFNDIFNRFLIQSLIDCNQFMLKVKLEVYACNAIYDRW